ncbi:MAG: hypothetical protein ABTQ32_15670 [Myxococcaceae bacterium]
MTLRWLTMLLLLNACARVPGPAVDSAFEARLESCRRCLAQGRTWQGPDACTANCDLQDTFCYRDRCPGACTAAACHDCQTHADCEGAGCRWNQANEAMWCTTK